MLVQILLVVAPMLLPSHFIKTLPYQGNPAIQVLDEGISISGEWIEGKAPGVRLETEPIDVSLHLPQKKGFYLSLKGDGNSYYLRVIVADKAGFLDQIPLRIKTTGKREKIFVSMDKRLPLVVSTPLAKSESPLFLLIEPVQKGKFSLQIGEIEWLNEEEEK